MIHICLRSFPQLEKQKLLPKRNSPQTVLAHESAHALDDVVNDHDSEKALKVQIEKYFPLNDIEYMEQDLVANLFPSLEYAALITNMRFPKVYDPKKVINTKETWKFNNEDADASVEFVSFFAETISQCIANSDNSKDFKQKFSDYITVSLEVAVKEIQEKYKMLVGPEEQLFALETIHATSELYLKAVDLELQNSKRLNISKGDVQLKVANIEKIEEHKEEQKVNSDTFTEIIRKVLDQYIEETKVALELELQTNNEEIHRLNKQRTVEKLKLTDSKKKA